MTSRPNVQPRTAGHRAGAAASRATRIAAASALCLLAIPPAGYAQVRRIEILTRETIAGPRAEAGGAFERVRGRVRGEVDPDDPRNRLIQDLALAPRNARGRVEYVATFALTRPMDARRASGVLVYTVVNRGNGEAAPSPEGHVTLVSGWQGDVTPTPTNQTIEVPVAHQPDGASITGPVLARFFDVPAGAHSMPIHIGSMGTAFYPPDAGAAEAATLVSHAPERPTGEAADLRTVPRDDWAFADCRTRPFPGTPDPASLCLKDGFERARVYELVYTAKDPLVLGIGLAATRDIASFFRYAAADATGTPNPVAGQIRHGLAFGASQSGNFIKTFIHLGFNQDLSGRRVFDGVLPFIAGRQLAVNIRFAAPGGAAGLYEPGSEAVLWWGRYADAARGRGPASLLDRCEATRTCPKVFEIFGSTEFWALRMSPGLVGTDAARDIPLPTNVRRYYVPGTTHGGGAGGFDARAVMSGACVLPMNPNPMREILRALTQALVDWVVRGTPPPPSRYPSLADGTLVAATRTATGFPAIPGVGFGLVNPVLDYDFGPGFAARDLSGIIDRQPPVIRGVLPTLVPRVDADGNEVSGVGSVLHQAPLGTYLGWNIRATGSFAGESCGFVGGFVPFVATRADRVARGDPRPSLEERYGTQEGYTCAVRRAAQLLVRDRFLLRDDADHLVAEAAASRLLPPAQQGSEEARRVAERLCR